MIIMIKHDIADLLLKERMCSRLKDRRAQDYGRRIRMLKRVQSTLVLTSSLLRDVSEWHAVSSWDQTRNVCFS